MLLVISVSNTATVTTTIATDVPPSTPSNIVISNITSNALTISWTASTDDGISQYHIFANSSTTALVVIIQHKVLEQLLIMLQDFLLQHHTISEYLQEILMVTFLLQDSLLHNTAAAPAGPATPTGLYANTFSDTEISTGNSRETG
jgi:hypothetical protein